MKWYVQLCWCNINIRGGETKSSADTMAKHMEFSLKQVMGELADFQGNGIANRRTFSEALSASTKEIAPFGLVGGEGERERVAYSGVK
jgi:hypothetical protein